MCRGTVNKNLRSPEEKATRHTNQQREKELTTMKVFAICIIATIITCAIMIGCAFAMTV